MNLPRPEDGCPRCLTHQRTVITRPWRVIPDGPGSIRASYRCGACGHQWHTWWSTRSLDFIEDGGTGDAA